MSIPSDPGRPGADAAPQALVPPLTVAPVSLTTPALGDLLRHWQAAAEEAGGLPGRAAVGFEVLRPWLSRLAIFARLDDGDWRVRLDGTDIVVETGIDWTGLTARRSSAATASSWSAPATPAPAAACRWLRS